MFRTFNFLQSIWILPARNARGSSFGKRSQRSETNRSRSASEDWVENRRKLASGRRGRDDLGEKGGENGEGEGMEEDAVNARGRRILLAPG